MGLLKTNDGTASRINIDRKLIGILSIFAILGLCLVTIIIIATDTLSGIRAYSTLQTHYTERRKEATLELIQYVQTENEAHYRSFHQALNMIENAKEARKELFKNETDRQKVRQHLLKTNTVPSDIGHMITVFERFHTFPDYKKAIDHWIRSDELIREMILLADSIQTVFNTQAITPKFRRSTIAAISSLDEELTSEQYKLAASLSQGTSFLNKIILWVSISLGAILLLTGILFSFRFMKSIKNWHKAIETSEQRYKSLFEYNPNAVFQMLPSGQLLSGNKSLISLSGYETREISSLKLNDLIASEHRKKVADRLEKAANGLSQSFEVVWENKDKNKTPIHLTLLPIYINNKITGVFGIAEDISYQKYAEQKIQEQLEEKTQLLFEVHDRVKNNLAVISGLLQLQQETAETEKTRKHLESAVSRIHSMALVHERLYQSKTFANIQFDEFIRELSYSVRQTFQVDPSKYQIHIQTDEVTLGLKKAISAGLLVNELLKNAFSSAFSACNEGKINVSLLKKNSHIVLEVADNANGIGLSKDSDSKQHAPLGLKLIHTLATQLNATVEIENNRGTKFTFHIPSDQ